MGNEISPLRLVSNAAGTHLKVQMFAHAISYQVQVLGIRVHIIIEGFCNSQTRLCGPCSTHAGGDRLCTVRTMTK